MQILRLPSRQWFIYFAGGNRIQNEKTTIKIYHAKKFTYEKIFYRMLFAFGKFGLQQYAFERETLNQKIPTGAYDWTETV